VTFAFNALCVNRFTYLFTASKNPPQWGAHRSLWIRQCIMLQSKLFIQLSVFYTMVQWYYQMTYRNLQ